MADTPRRTRPWIAIAVIAVAVVALSFSVGRLTAPSVSTPSNTSAEAGFARDMQVHHNQAVAMSLTVRDLTTDPEVRLLAYDIATAQANQSGQMYGWLGEWGLPQVSPEPDMTWMTRPALPGKTDSGDHGMDMGDGSSSTVVAGGAMPGYATSAQLARLATLAGTDAERYFLQLMIAHHQGGVEMAQAIVERSTRTSVLALANGIIVAQTSEIAVMKDMLEARGGELGAG